MMALAKLTIGGNMFKSKLFIINVFLAVGSIIITLICCEIMFRVFNIKPPAKKADAYDEPNSKKRRDHGYAYEKAEGVFRIVATGDSFTRGLGVRNVDDIFLMRLEKTLNRGSRKYEVINGAGQERGDTAGEYQWLKNEGVKFSPDLIIVVYFFNDATDTGSNFYIAAPLSNALINAKTWSFLYNYLKYKIMRQIKSRETIKAYKAAYFDESKSHLWNECQDSILAIKKLAQNNNAKLLFVVFPILFDLDKNYCFQDMHDAIFNFLKKIISQCIAFCRILLHIKEIRNLCGLILKMRIRTKKRMQLQQNLCINTF